MLKLKYILPTLVLSLAGSAFFLTPPPAPVGLSINEDLRQAVATPQTPEIGDIFFWLASPGAVGYNVYERQNPGLDKSKCGTPPTTKDAFVTTTYYVDAPNPGWWKLPTSDTDGRWKARAWCYWVSGVNLLGMEGPLSGPESITIGNAGYVFWYFRSTGTYNVNDLCAAGPEQNPPTLNLADYILQLWYDNGDGVRHFFQLQTLFERNVVATIWHAPSIATDGYVIPLPGMPGDVKGRFGYTFTHKPTRETVTGSWTPVVGKDGNFYTQVSVGTNTLNGKPCAYSYFAAFDPMQNVVTE